MAAKKHLSRKVTAPITGERLTFDWSNVWADFFLSGEYQARLAAYTAGRAKLAGAGYSAPALATASRKNATVAYYRCHSGNSVAVTITDDDGNEVVLTGRKAEAHRYGGDPVTSFFRTMHHNVSIGLNVDMPFGSPRTGAQTADIEL